MIKLISNLIYQLRLFNLYYVLGIGIPFEIYEYVHYKCENYLDIVYNVIGGVIGCYLRVYL
jgi:hypothetical protein